MLLQLITQTSQQSYSSSHINPLYWLRPHRPPSYHLRQKHITEPFVDRGAFSALYNLPIIGRGELLAGKWLVNIGICHCVHRAACKAFRS